jgi:hypothetical protein
MNRLKSVGAIPLESKGHASQRGVASLNDSLKHTIWTIGDRQVRAVEGARNAFVRADAC